MGPAQGCQGTQDQVDFRARLITTRRSLLFYVEHLFISQLKKKNKNKRERQTDRQRDGERYDASIVSDQESERVRE